MSHKDVQYRALLWTPTSPDPWMTNMFGWPTIGWSRMVPRADAIE